MYIFAMTRTSILKWMTEVYHKICLPMFTCTQMYTNALEHFPHHMPLLSNDIPILLYWISFFLECTCKADFSHYLCRTPYVGFHLNWPFVRFHLKVLSHLTLFVRLHLLWIHFFWPLNYRDYILTLHIYNQENKTFYKQIPCILFQVQGQEIQNDYY